MNNGTELRFLDSNLIRLSKSPMCDTLWLDEFVCTQAS